MSFLRPYPLRFGSLISTISRTPSSYFGKLAILNSRHNRGSLHRLLSEGDTTKMAFHQVCDICILRRSLEFSNKGKKTENIEIDTTSSSSFSLSVVLDVKENREKNMAARTSGARSTRKDFSSRFIYGLARRTKRKTASRSLQKLDKIKLITNYSKFVQPSC